MHSRTRQLVLAGLTACALAAASALPAYASSPTWGYDSAAVNPDGSLDFETDGTWTSAGTVAAGDPLGYLDFTMGGIAYTVTVNVPAFGATSGGPWGGLFANIIAFNGTDNSYSWWHGTSASSPVLLTDSAGEMPYHQPCLNPDSAMFFTKSDATNLAVAYTVQLYDCGTGIPSLQYSEVLDVSDAGTLTHTVTLTNISETDLVETGLLVGLDTQLNDNDETPIYAGAGGSAYIEDSNIHLDLKLLNGDVFLAGAWDWWRNPETFTDVQAATAGDVIVPGSVDTFVYRGLSPRDLPSNTSWTLAFSESLVSTAPAPQPAIVVDSGGTVATAGGATGLAGLLLVGLGIGALAVRRVRG